MTADSLHWVAGQLGLVVLEERADGTVHASDDDAPSSLDLASELGERLRVGKDDRRVAQLLEGARRGESAGADFGALGASVRVLARKHGEGLQVVLAPSSTFADEGSGRVAAGVAHELANSLTVIAGWAQLALSAGPMTDRARDALRIVARSTDVALGTARSLLSAARGEASAQSSCDASTEIANLLEAQTPLACASGVVVRGSIAPDVRLRLGAPELTTIVSNLVKNAIEAQPDGGEVRVTLRAHGSEAVLLVDDDGPGMDADLRARIFEPWFTTKGTGTGLGLALVRELVERAGGIVDVESAPGRGTRFCITLPAKGAAGAARSDVRAREVVTESPRRVLVVDDDPALRELCRTALELRGVHVHAVDGVAAASLVTARYDVAFVDLHLGDGNGAQLIETLRARGSATRIVVMSGARDARATRAADGVLAKPFEITDLVSMLDDVTRRPAAER